ncbi:MAG: hypothetical protein HUU35_20495, partial [Armatimonadetes bacterium]|nr:hypothetical protein [Armatimonadota bacterium]
HWRLRGPFAQPKDDGPALIAAAIPEEAQAVAGQTAGDAWRAAQADERGWVNLGAALGADRSVVGYAVTVIKADQAWVARLRLGVDYWLAAWLNGELVYRVVEGHGSPRASRHLVDVPLRAGDNVLCLKVGSGGKGFGFWANLSRPGWDPRALAGEAPLLPSLYDRGIALADPYEFHYW